MSEITMSNILLATKATKYIDIEKSCDVVFIFAIKFTLVASFLSFLAFKSLSALIQISLEIIIADKKASKVLFK